MTRLNWDILRENIRFVEQSIFLPWQLNLSTLDRKKNTTKEPIDEPWHRKRIQLLSDAPKAARAATAISQSSFAFGILEKQEINSEMKAFNTCILGPAVDVMPTHVFKCNLINPLLLLSRPWPTLGWPSTAFSQTVYIASLLARDWIKIERKMTSSFSLV